MQGERWWGQEEIKHGLKMAEEHLSWHIDENLQALHMCLALSLLTLIMTINSQRSMKGAAIEHLALSST